MSELNIVEGTISIVENELCVTDFSLVDGGVNLKWTLPDDQILSEQIVDSSVSGNFVVDLFPEISANTLNTIDLVDNEQNLFAGQATLVDEGGDPDAAEKCGLVTATQTPSPTPDSEGMGDCIVGCNVPIGLIAMVLAGTAIFQI